MVGLSDRTEHVGEVGAKLRMVSQHLLVPEGRRHNDVNPVRIPRLARNLFLRHRRTFAEHPEVHRSICMENGG
jgi:hypothetical protein